MARVIRDVVSDAITHHLSDPRITGLVSVTRVEVVPDMRSADVFLSILAPTEGAKNRTYAAIVHARPKIQSILGRALESKFCPVLRIHEDEQFRRTLETMKLIDQVASEHQHEDTEPDENA